MCTEDVVFSGPGGPRVSGEALRTRLDNFPVQTSMTFDFDRIEVGGDLAAVYGSGIMTLQVEEDEVPMYFDFVDILRKDQSGNWLYSSVIFNDKDVPD
jgi:ketosteroid isomerase-like protein